jgi:hypothetical protein
MPKKSIRLRDSVTALAALQYDHARIVDGRVTDTQAAAILLQAVQAHVRALLACTPHLTPRQASPAIVDMSTITDAQLYAHYKRTSAAEDLRFFLRGGKSAALLARARAITTPTARDLVSLREAWRIERDAEDRAAGIPAIGSENWHRQMQAEPIDEVGVL